MTKNQKTVMLVIISALLLIALVYMFFEDHLKDLEINP